MLKGRSEYVPTATEHGVFQRLLGYIVGLGGYITAGCRSLIALGGLSLFIYGIHRLGYRVFCQLYW